MSCPPQELPPGRIGRQNQPMKTRNPRNDRSLRRNPASPNLFARRPGSRTDNDRPAALLSSGRHGAGHLSLSLLELYKGRPGYNQGMRRLAVKVRRSGPPSGEVARISPPAAFIYDEFSCGGFPPIYDYNCVSISDSTPAPGRDSRSYCQTWIDPLEAGGLYNYRARRYSLEMIPEGYAA